ncbi:MAG: polyphosphate polymerase domain-containing protein [Myxococcales bacterium]
MSDPLLIPDRHELKFIIPEHQVDSVRAAIRPFCDLDHHCQTAPDHQYVIESLYLDTPRRDLYRVSRERRASRFKLRVRRYGTKSDRVFFEVKNKDRGMIRKLRAKVPVEGWADRLEGAYAQDAGAAEVDFRARTDRYLLRPTVLVRYEREAYVSLVDDYARVTFDRRVVCQPHETFDFEADPSSWRSIDHGLALKRVRAGVVLELEVHRRRPALDDPPGRVPGPEADGRLQVLQRRREHLGPVVGVALCVRAR